MRRSTALYPYEPNPTLTPAQQAVARAVEIHWGGVTLRGILGWIDHNLRGFNRRELDIAIVELVEMGTIRFLPDGLTRAFREKDETQVEFLQGVAETALKLRHLEGHRTAVLLPVGGFFPEDMIGFE
jgi:hypothetical protein